MTLTQTHIENIITAAIDADMRVRGFMLVGDKYVYVRGASDYEPIKDVPAPGHGDTGEIVIGHEYNYDVATEVTINPTADVYDPWRERIETAFKGWKGEELPKPSDFETLYAQLDKGAAHLAGGGGNSSGSNTAGDVDLAATVSTIESELAPYAGATVDAFQKNYVARLAPTFANQSICGSVLAIAAKTEADVWTKANESIVSIATESVTAFDESVHGDGGGDVALTVVGILAAAAGLVVPPAAAASIAVGSTVLGIIKDAKSLIPEQKKTTSLAGSSPDAVYENLVSAIDDLSLNISQEETHTGNMLWQTYTTMIGAERSNYDLSRPTALYSETDINKLNKTDVDTATLKTIGNSYMPEVATALRGAATELDVGTSGIWNRPVSIGNYYTGPFHEADSLSNQLIDFLKVTAQECEDSGEILVIAANNINSTDDTARTALKGHQDDIEAEPEDYGRPARDGGWYMPNGKYLPPA
ncbi:hypothetical protein ASG90_09795 [Nocardioides sp. Soil797]|nr:hypothetical protein ASG90_09795 [Nocardioides sp. Soil797]